MIKKVSKINISLLIVAMVAILFCGLFAINNLTAKKVHVAHAEGTSATLKGSVSVDKSDGIWWMLLDYDIENLIITNNFDTSTAIGEPVDVSEEQNGSLYAYKIDNGDGTYNCVIYADVDIIYAPVNSRCLFSGMDPVSNVFTILRNVKTIIFKNNCFNTSNTQDMVGMFSACAKLTELDLSGFTTNHLTNYESLQIMFNGCFALQQLDISSFDFNNITNKTALGENFFGYSFDMACLMLSAMGTLNIPEGVNIYDFLEQQMQSDNATERMFALMFMTVMGSEVYTNIKLPKNMQGIELYLPLENELYVNGNEAGMLQTQVKQFEGVLGGTFETEVFVITETEAGTTLKLLNSATPNTGFVDEQLLPAIAISFTGIMVLCYVFSISKSKNRI